MNLKSFMKNPGSISKRKKVEHKVERKSRKSSGNSADDVLINEPERMSKYISNGNRQKIVSVRTAYRYGVMKIGSEGDPAQILKNNLIPETTNYARRKASITFFRNFHSDLISFWSKNRFARKISYERNGKTVSYFMGLDARTGKRVSIPERIKNKLR